MDESRRKKKIDKEKKRSRSRVRRRSPDSERDNPLNNVHVVIAILINVEGIKKLCIS